MRYLYNYKYNDNAVLCAIIMELQFPIVPLNFKDENSLSIRDDAQLNLHCPHCCVGHEVLLLHCCYNYIYNRTAHIGHYSTVLCCGSEAHDLQQKLVCCQWTNEHANGCS